MKPGRIRGTQTGLRSVCEGLASILLGPETQETGRNDGAPARACCAVRHNCATSSLFSNGDCGGCTQVLGPEAAQTEDSLLAAAAARAGSHVLSHAGASNMRGFQGRVFLRPLFLPPQK